MLGTILIVILVLLLFGRPALMAVQLRLGLLPFGRSRPHSGDRADFGAARKSIAAR